MTTEKALKTWNGQRVTETIAGEDFLPCAACGELVGMRSTAWYDTHDKKQKHLRCLSVQRKGELMAMTNNPMNPEAFQ